MIIKDELKKFLYEIEIFFESKEEVESFAQFVVEKKLEVKDFGDSTILMFKTPNCKEVKDFQEWKIEKNF